VYKGFGAQCGVNIAEEDGLAYASGHLECLNAAEQRELRKLLEDGMTAGELEEWYFSGSFCRVMEK
jgi:hypothetical protein